jgi:hypothetical protein
MKEMHSFDLICIFGMGGIKVGGDPQFGVILIETANCENPCQHTSTG